LIQNPKSKIQNSEIVRIYIDGACRGNPGPGGWGAILLYGERRKELYGGEDFTTNNRMELTAAIRALEALKRPVQCQIFTDSSYLYNGIAKWLPRWKARNWRLTSGKPVENRDLWELLSNLAATHEIQWRWIRGHSGYIYNEEADRLAVAAIPKNNANVNDNVNDSVKI